MFAYFTFLDKSTKRNIYTGHWTIQTLE